MSDITTFIKLIHMLNREKEERKMRLKDDNGKWVQAGDTIQFSYGMPPVSVDAQIEEWDGRLVVVCPDGFTPPTSPLRSLRNFVGPWYKVEG